MALRKEDLSKYYKLTNAEFSSLVQVVARIFIGHDLCFYLVKTKDGVGYIRCGDLDNICDTFKVSIEGKSDIKRISFKTPEGFNLDSLIYCRYRRLKLEPTDASKADAYAIFPNGIFVYLVNVASDMKKYINSMFVDYCMSKYKREIEAEREARYEREGKEFLGSLVNMPFVEVTDDYLNEVVGYVCVDDSMLLSQIAVAYGERATAYSAAILLTVADVKALGLGLKIVDKFRGTSKLLVKRSKTAPNEVSILRLYGKITYNSKLINITFRQIDVGLVSSVPQRLLSKHSGRFMGINCNEYFVYEGTDNFTQVLENFRLRGNKWFANNGNSFIKDTPSRSRKPLPKDDRPVGAFGLIADAFKNS